MFQNRTIGILGGMGPAATAHFMALFVRAMNARGVTCDGDFPKIIVLSLPLSDWDETGSLDLGSVSAQVMDGVTWLLKQGAELVAVPCNSVHEFWSWRSPETLSIIDETRAVARGRLGVLCSEQTRRANLYGPAIYPEDQSQVTIAIDRVLRGDTPDIDTLIAELYHRGAETVVLGCTELSLCKRTLRTVDSSEALARALAARL